MILGRKDTNFNYYAGVAINFLIEIRTNRSGEEVELSPRI
jgi:hypothetical protein